MIKRKIAFVLPSLNMGGAQRVVTTLTNALNKNYEVFVITFTYAEPFYRLDDNITIINCVNEIKPSKNTFEAIRNNYILLRKINSSVKENKVDLLIGFLTPANILATLVAKFNRIPVIISERNNPYLRKAPKIWQLIRSIIYPMADYVVVQSETIKSYYSNKINKDRLQILPNPISEELTLKRDNSIKKENLILNAGRLTDQKAQDMLIKAFAKTKNENWKLIIAGEGPKRLQYEKLIKNLDLNKKVLLVGLNKNIDELYNKSKIFAFSSVYEGFPNALIEAMYFGLACISTNCPSGPAELIDSGSNGFLIPMNDIPMMTEKLNILMHDVKMLKKIGEQAAISVSKYETNTVVMQWKKLIEDCLNN